MTKTSTAVATKESSPSLLKRVGARYGLDPAKVYDTLCKTAFRDAKNQEQVIALLVVADQYKLNPFTREIYAFPGKNGEIVPVVGIDGWLRIINDHPQYDGMSFAEAEEKIQVGKSKEAPEWMECTIYRKDRSHAEPVREYLDEVYRDTPAWNQTTARMLRHRCIMQAARVAFGFGGIVDPDEAERAAEFDFEGTVLAEEIVNPIGAADYKKLIKQAERFCYTEEDVRATAATLGYEGPGKDMPEDIAQRIFESMKANPKLDAPTEQPSVDQYTGEVLEGEVMEEEPVPAASGFKTPLMGDD